MATITLNIPDDRLTRLQQAAVRLGIAPEDLLRASLEQLLTEPDDELKRTVDYVLNKNAELYRRLA